MNIAIATLGCKVNQYEGESLGSLLAKRARIVSFGQRADAYIVNTCAVTGEAAHKSRKLMYRARRSNPAAVLIVIGCYATIDAAAVKESGADLVLPKRPEQQTAEVIADYLGLATSHSEDSPTAARPMRARRYLKVQDGCDQFCSYCVIPYARSGLHSKPPEELIGEVRRLEAQGAAEIIVTGIHVGKYGVAAPGVPPLDLLLEMLITATDSCRFRISSIEATELSSGLLDLMASRTRLCKHLHVPLQSGSDGVLAAMNRPYDVETYRRAVEIAVSGIEGLALTTDLIVGFPGETEEDLLKSLQFCEETGFSKIHVFAYSDRAPARATLMSDKVPEEEKNNRSARARNMAARMRQRFAAGRIGIPEEVAVERVDSGIASGTTGSYLPARFPAGDSKVGDLVEVRVVGVERDVLMGE